MIPLIANLLALLTCIVISSGSAHANVYITEVMYDDTASNDLEWIELHNNFTFPVDIGAWIITDNEIYPPMVGEGGIGIPSGTIIGGGQYMVFSAESLPDITGEVVCVPWISNFVLANTGDNIAVYTDSLDGSLVDGSLTVAYPDLAPNNSGVSIEKCDPNTPWTADPAAWHTSTNLFSTSGRYRYCTPGAPNTTCIDLPPPSVSSCAVISNQNIDIVFSESLHEASAETESNYLIIPGNFVPDTATLDNSNPTLVHLAFDPPLPNNNYTVIVSGVQDISGNPMAPDSCTFTVGQVIQPCDVVITEIMYDDTASTDAEWVEILNTTGSPIDISGWVLLDDDVYPANGGEGAIRVPANTFLNGYKILSRVNLPGITGEVICSTISGTWTLANGGDNLALYTAASGGIFVDGSLSVPFPDLAGNNAGNSIEKCDYGSCWTGVAAAWTESEVQFAAVGQYRHCTPFDEGFCCTEPPLATIEVVQFGPPDWVYLLRHVSGCIDRLAFTNFCEGTTGSVTNLAHSDGWSVMSNGDGNDGDSIIFIAATPFSGTQGDTVMGFVLTHPTCADLVNWAAGNSTGTIDGPLPIEFNGFDAVAGNGEVQLNWSTASEAELDRFELKRDGETIVQITARNSESGSTYRYTDSDVTNDETYQYELSVVSVNGEREVLATESATPRSGNSLVTEFALHQNYPNPFNPETSIRFDLIENSLVNLTVYNVAGQEVATPVNGNLNAGSHTVTFDGANLTSGVYLYRLTAGEFTSTMKMVLMK